MPSLLVICPSRGRPTRARSMRDSFLATKRLASTDLVFVLHEGDPEFGAYDVDPWVSYPEGTTLTAKLNLAAAEFAPAYDYIQFAADDMLYRTLGWDAVMTSTMEQRGLAFGYANDLIRNDVANHAVADTRAVRALGWFALPGSRHLYLDNVWMALGSEAQSIGWFSDVVIEHLHPLFGRGTMDESYRETNSAERYADDAVAFEEWRANRLESDARTVREAMRADRGRHANGRDRVPAGASLPQGAGADVRR